jgi:hypothetical protein
MKKKTTPDSPEHRGVTPEGERGTGSMPPGGDEIIHLAIRGYASGKLQFEEFVGVDFDHLEDVVPGLAEKHAAAMASHNLHMIEIEFLDEPDQNARFFRFGTDPAGMVMPLQITLGESDAG